MASNTLHRHKDCRMRLQLCRLLLLLYAQLQVSHALSYGTAEHFLKEFMPARDQSLLSEDFVRDNIKAALAAKNSREWTASVPEAIFLDYVLPYSSMDEQRDGCRHIFRPIVTPLVHEAKSISEAALTVNKLLWAIWGIYFKPNQTPRIESPTQVLKAGFASCTGLSIFLVCALRSVGIPARVTGTPAWKSGGPGLAGGNHDWVEVWTENGWSFTGPTEYTPKGWNTTWFFPDPVTHQVPGSRAHGVFATAWRATNVTFPLSWAADVDYVNAIDVTQTYIDAAEPTSYAAAACVRPASVSASL